MGSEEREGARGCSDYRSREARRAIESGRQGGKLKRILEEQERRKSMNEEMARGSGLVNIAGRFPTEKKEYVGQPLNGGAGLVSTSREGGYNLRERVEILEQEFSQLRMEFAKVASELFERVCRLETMIGAPWEPRNTPVNQISQILR